MTLYEKLRKLGCTVRKSGPWVIYEHSHHALTIFVDTHESLARFVGPPDGWIYFSPDVFREDAQEFKTVEDLITYLKAQRAIQEALDIL